jgi:hypothetical protein
MDNVQNCDSYVNTPSSQTYISFWGLQLFLKFIIILDDIYEII